MKRLPRHSSISFLGCFAGIWTNWTSARKIKEGETTNDLYAFLTTGPLIIEPLSLDEAYLDVTENLQGIPLARDIALAIRAKIKEVTGLNASAGISYNKFLAKLASDYRKPNGQFVITPVEMEPAFVETLPAGKFYGIGPATARRRMHGLCTGLDMRNQSYDFMQANFGKAVAYYYWISRGVDNREAARR